MRRLYEWCFKKNVGSAASAKCLLFRFVHYDFFSVRDDLFGLEAADQLLSADPHCRPAAVDRLGLGRRALGPQERHRRPGNWFFWDGKIIKGSDGTYHLFCSRWAASTGFGNWGNSNPMHATSSNLIGPYTFQNEVYPNYQGDKGHNTSAVAMPDGAFAVVASEIVPGWIFTSRSLDGPWTFQKAISWNDPKGYCNSSTFECGETSNLTINVGPDKRFWATSRHGQIMDADSITGPYTLETGSIYPTTKNNQASSSEAMPNVPGMTWEDAEDPLIWYSGGYYHVIVRFLECSQSREPRRPGESVPGGRQCAAGVSPHVSRRDPQLDQYRRRL